MASRTFAVSFAFTCSCCDERYPKGTTGRYGNTGKLIAAECPNLPDSEIDVDLNVQAGSDNYVPTEAEQAQARAQRCGKCFLVHAKHQEDCA